MTQEYIEIKGARENNPKNRTALYLFRLRNIKTSLTGADLQKPAVHPGPRMKEMLHRLLEARLDGELMDRRGEEKLVKKLAARA